MKDLNELPSENDFSREELAAMGIVPSIHTTTKTFETTFNEMKVDGRMLSAQCQAKWDSYSMDIRISLPMEFSELKTLDVFQEILDDVVKTMRKEKGSEKSVFLP